MMFGVQDDVLGHVQNEDLQRLLDAILGSQNVVLRPKMVM